MESKDLPIADNSPFQPSSKRAPPHLDASKFQLAADADEESLLSAQGTPTPSTGSSSAVFTNTMTQGRPRAMTQSSPSLPILPTAHVRNRSATVANPPKSAPPGSGAPEREKRKRSRVTPEQLMHLERLFAIDRSPTAAKRKEISELLGMQERQTQIWFQNRRAKAKTLEGKGKMGFRGSPHSGGESPPETPSEFNPAVEVDLQTLIHEDEPVTFIPCSDLTIGSWRRISATLNQHDLVAYISPSKRCLTWFIYSNGYGFKMEIPFDSITSTNFSKGAPGQGLATFYLSRPPLFYLESMSSPASGLGTTKFWKKCADWTEGQQASKILRHDLLGAAVPLVNALKCIPMAEHPNSTPSAPMGHYPTDSMPTMHIPQPPLANLESHSFSHAAHTDLMHGRKRSFSVPAILPQSSHSVPDYSLLSGPQSDSSETLSASFSGTFSERATSLAFPQEYSAPLFRSFPSIQPQSNTAHHHSQSSLTDFSTVPISHAAASRPYSASPVDARFPFDSAPPSVLHGAPDQFSHRGASPNQFGSISSSPPLLTAAFDPTTLHHSVTSAEPASLEMDTSQYGSSAHDSQSASQEPQFHGTLDMGSSQHARPPS